MALTIPKLDKRTSLIIAGITIMMLFIAIFFIFSNNKVDRTTIWNIIPNEALAVVEIDNLNELQEDVYTNNSWQNIVGLEYLNETQKITNWFDSLKYDFPEIYMGQEEWPAWISIHRSSHNDIGFLYYVAVPFKQQKLTEVFQYIGIDSSWKKSSYQYYDWEVHELKSNTQHKYGFSYIFQDDYLIISNTAYLLEDVIRHCQANMFAPQSWKRISNTFDRKDFEGEAINIYLNHQALPNLTRSVLEEAFKDDGNWLANLTDATALSFSFWEDSITISGKTAYKLHDQNRFFELFEDYKPEPSDLPSIIPNSTAYCYRLAFEDASQFFRGFYQIQQVKFEDIEAIWDSFDFNIEDFWEQIDSEISHAQLAQQHSNELPQQLLLVKVKDTSQVADQLQELLETAREQGLNSQFTQFKHHLIGYIPIPDFPNHVFGDHYKHFDDCYFTMIKNYLVIANSKKGLEELLSSISKDQVWANTTQYYALAEAITQPYHIAFTSNLINTWPFVQSPLSSIWEQAFRMNRRHLANIDHFYFAFNLNTAQLKGKVFINDDPLVSNDSLFKHTQSYVLDLPVAPKSSLELVYNHNDSSSELMFQDRWNRMNLVSNDGKKLWATQIGEPISSPIFQIDLYGNKKNQYLFASGNQINLLDRLGRQVNGFPIYTPNPIETMNVLDYEKSQNYLFVVSDIYGQVYMIDKYNKLRFGWQPKRLNGPLAQGVGHLKLAEKNYLAAIQQDGVIFVLDQYGVTLDQFPISLKENLNNFTFVKGDNLENTYVKILSAKGLIIYVNFKGKIIKRFPLPKSIAGAKFIMHFDDLGSQSHIISCQEDKKITFFDSNSKLLFSQEFSSSGQKVIQYFYLSLEQQVIAVTDQQSQKTHLFYPSGELISNPFESEHGVSVHFDAANQAYYLQKCFGKRLEAIKLRL